MADGQYDVLINGAQEMSFRILIVNHDHFYALVDDPVGRRVLCHCN